jgi:broad specificity phosphatase PhoE
MNKDNRVYLIRHGQTAWSLSGQHTGLTDIPLTQEGERRAQLLQAPLTKVSFAAILSSPLQRAQQTALITGLKPVTDLDLVEWNYGDYEGKKSVEIQGQHPGWNVFRDGCPGGEKPDEIGLRADRVIARIRKLSGHVALFSHGHFLRVLAARWLGLKPQAGALLALDTESISILGFEHNLEEPVLHLWNSTDHLV